MAITLNQEPTQYNVVVSPNVFTLGSITANEDSYVLQVEKLDEYTGTYTTLATIQQPANPAGVGIYDISKILQAQMSIAWVEDTGVDGLTANPIGVQTPGAMLSYRIQYGSVTNNLITFEGTSAVKHVINGYDNWRYKDWPTQDTFIPEPTAFTCEGGGYTNANYDATGGAFLTNYPGNITLRSNTQHTLSFFNRIGNYNSGPNWGNSEQPYAIRIKFYDINNNLITTAVRAISASTGLGPRVDFNSDANLTYTTAQVIGTIGAGPENLKNNGLWPANASAVWNLVSQQWGNNSQIWNLATTTAIVDHYTIDIMSVDMCYWADNGAPVNPGALTLDNYLDDVIYTKSFQLADPCTGYDPITVSFVNQYGVKDYYTFDRRNTLNQSIKRNDYDQVLGSWSAAAFNIDPHGRGRRTFSTEISTKMTMASYWMEDDESKWLEELFTSPHVQVKYDGVWEPAVITSRGYSQKTNSRDGLFQHTLEIEFANTKKVQRG